MATNLKGQSGIKGFLLLHGEKIAIVIVGALSLWIIYSSIKVPSLDDKYQADKLQAQISQASNAIKEYTWDRAVSEQPDKVKKAQPITASGDLTVDSKHYVNLDPNGKAVFGFDEHIVAPLIVRTDPPLLNAVDVRATGGSGLYSFLDEEIRNKQRLRLMAEEEELAKKDLAKQRKDAKKQQTGEGPGGRGPEGVTQPVDPLHPKRRQVQNSGQAQLAGVPLQGGERIERASWACVVAKVPIREQLKLYQDAFEKARGSDATKDFPSYVGFFVERAEVLPGKELQWKAVPLYDGQRKGQPSIADNKPLTAEAAGHVVAKPAYDKLVEAAMSFWSGGIAPDVIDQRFAEYPLTLPLPPLVGRQWGAEATHPDIPLAIDTPALEPETQPLETTPAQQPEGATTSAFGSAAPTQAGPGAANSFGTGRPGGSEFSGPGGGPGARMYGPGGPGGGPGSSFPGGRRMMMEGPGGPSGGPEGGSYRGGGSGQAAGQHTFLQKGVDFYLLRFFDFSVEPGKRYKYRVKLVVSDPNYGVLPAFLAGSVQDRQAKEGQAAKAKGGEKPFFRIIENWSDPSPTVGIPLAGNVRLADAKIPPGDKVNDEPAVRLLVEAFDVDETGNPIQAAAEKDFRRGYVANMVQDTEYLVEGGQFIDTLPDFKFRTGMLVLDIDGGAKLAKDLTVPARLMVMGPAGELYIRSEIEDKPLVENHRILFAKPDKNAGPEGPGGPGPGRGRGRP